jgi:uncharacterized damage-inducible protein DinB
MVSVRPKLHQPTGYNVATFFRRSQTMKLAELLARQLTQSRDFCEKLLDSFKTPEDWTHQIAPGTNHALWFAGHMAASDNFFIGMLDPAKKRNLDDWSGHFGMGSQPTSDPDDYPPVAEVLDAMRERRTVLLELLGKMSDGDLAKATPPDVAGFCPDYAAIFQMGTWHEGLHAGQITMIRRALGHKPVFSPETAEAS